MKHTPVKDKLHAVCEGVKMSHKPDNTWLHFESSDGQKCSFSIESKFPTVCASAIRGWAYDQLADPIIYFMCKCGEEIEGGKDTEEHEVLCPSCKRRGCVERQPF